MIVSVFIFMVISTAIVFLAIRDTSQEELKKNWQEYLRGQLK
jgi:hypothetical protein